MNWIVPPFTGLPATVTVPVTWPSCSPPHPARASRPRTTTIRTRMSGSSIRVRVGHLAAVDTGQVVQDLDGGRFGQEPDVPVGEQELGPAGVEAPEREVGLLVVGDVRDDGVEGERGVPQV